MPFHLQEKENSLVGKGSSNGYNIDGDTSSMAARKKKLKETVSWKKNAFEVLTSRFGHRPVAKLLSEQSGKREKGGGMSQKATAGGEKDRLKNWRSRNYTTEGGV